MEMSFWVGAVGAKAQQNKLDITGNNLANVNNNGYKPKEAAFSELVNYNLNGSHEEVTDLQAGAGEKVAATRTNFNVSGMTVTNQPYDYMINKYDGFFAVQDIQTGETTYQKDGHFHAGQMADGSYQLLTQSGKAVLNAAGEQIKLNLDVETEENAQPQTAEEAAAQLEAETPGVYQITFPTRLLSLGDNEFGIRPEDVNNQAVAMGEDVPLTQGVLETSGTDMAREMTNMIESQRAFQYAVRMIQTSDDLAGTVNSLRN